MLYFLAIKGPDDEGRRAWGWGWKEGKCGERYISLILRSV